MDHLGRDKFFIVGRMASISMLRIDFDVEVFCSECLENRRGSVSARQPAPPAGR